MRKLLQRLLACERGQDLIEYALLATVVALACIGGISALERAVAYVFGVIAGQLGNAGS